MFFPPKLIILCDVVLLTVSVRWKALTDFIVTFLLSHGAHPLNRPSLHLFIQLLDQFLMCSVYNINIKIFSWATFVSDNTVCPWTHIKPWTYSLSECSWKPAQFDVNATDRHFRPFHLRGTTSHSYPKYLLLGVFLPQVLGMTAVPEMPFCGTNLAPMGSKPADVLTGLSLDRVAKQCHF